MTRKRKPWSPETRAKIIAARNKPLEHRFWPKVEVRGADECWPWLRAHNGIGYGVMTFGGQQLLATHASLKLAGRERPDGAFACHHCDNPGCVNPAHLFWGTPSDNTQDAYKKGRITTPTERGHARPARIVSFNCHNCGVACVKTLKLAPPTKTGRNYCSARCCTQWLASNRLVGKLAA
jgi:hypothetical protein